MDFFELIADGLEKNVVVLLSTLRNMEGKAVPSVHVFGHLRFDDDLVFREFPLESFLSIVRLFCQGLLYCPFTRSEIPHRLLVSVHRIYGIDRAGQFLQLL